MASHRLVTKKDGDSKARISCSCGTTTVWFTSGEDAAGEPVTLDEAIENWKQALIDTGHTDITPDAEDAMYERILARLRAEGHLKEQ